MYAIRLGVSFFCRSSLAKRLISAVTNRSISSNIHQHHSAPSLTLFLAQNRNFNTDSTSQSSRSKSKWRKIYWLVVPSIAFFAAVKMSNSKRRKTEDDGDSDSDVDGGLPDYRRHITNFSDPAIGANHGIELNAACVKIIQTPEFNRLHDIKQTGASYWVYPSAKHSRFEHLLGTCYLAGKVVKRLKKMQPELNITDRDTLAVEIAALCHDLGHGPFSHTFDGQFLPLARPGHNWEHEKATVDMFHHLLKKNPEVKAYLENILEPEDFIFIEEAIRPRDEVKQPEWPHKGRPFEKAYLYDIVSNKSNGIDVDKLDYITRDSYHMSVSTNANVIRLCKNMRVLPVGDNRRPTICYRDKVVGDLTNLSRTRAQLHTVAYQHRTVTCVEVMLVDAMLIADKHIVAPGHDGKLFCLSECIDDMEAYSKFNDGKVLSDIICSTSAEMEPARAIIERIRKRNLYAKIGEVESGKKEINDKFGNGLCTKTSAKIAAYLSSCQQEHPNVDRERLEKSLAVMIVDIHGGMKDENPVEKVWLFKKVQSEAFRMDAVKAKNYAPPIRQKIIRVFCRENDADLISCGRRCFDEWCSENGLQTTDSDESGHFSPPPASDGE